MGIRLPDPFTVNGAPGFSTADLIDNHPIIRDELRDGSILIVKDGAQYWSIDITYPDLLPTEYSLILSTLEESKRTGKSLLILLPQYLHFRVTTDINTLSIPAGLSGSLLTINGMTNALPFPGDLLQLSNSISKKVYRITSIDTSISNKVTLGLYPDLVVTTTGAEKPEFNNILFNTILSDWEHTTSINTDGLYTGVNIRVRESK